MPMYVVLCPSSCALLAGGYVVTKYEGDQGSIMPHNFLFVSHVIVSFCLGLHLSVVRSGYDGYTELRTLVSYIVN